MAEKRRIIAYEHHSGKDNRLTTAPVDRDWMDASPQRFAYRCLPLAIANQAGWFLHSPATFSAIWDGGLYGDAVRIEFEAPGYPPPANPWAISIDSTTITKIAAARDERVSSHFGVGTITFSLSFLFRTPPGINLWVKGPTNCLKDGIQALEGIVETDWLPATFTMNWKFTRPNHRVRFEKGEPICMIVPVPRGLAESLTPVRLPLTSDPALQKAHDDWLKARAEFIQKLAHRDPETVKRGWQRDYVHGISAGGVKAPEHQTRLDLKEFVRAEE